MNILVTETLKTFFMPFMVCVLVFICIISYLNQVNEFKVYENVRLVRNAQVATIDVKTNVLESKIIRLEDRLSAKEEIDLRIYAILTNMQNNLAILNDKSNKKK